MVRWVVGSILHRVDPLSYFSFQPVFHDLCNKGHGMYYPVCGMMHIKEPLLLIGKSSPCGSSGFPLSLSEWNGHLHLYPNCWSPTDSRCWGFSLRMVTWIYPWTGETILGFSVTWCAPGRLSSFGDPKKGTAVLPVKKKKKKKKKKHRWSRRISQRSLSTSLFLICKICIKNATAIFFN